MTLQKNYSGGKKYSIWQTTALLTDKPRICKLSHKARTRLISWSLPLCVLLSHCSSILRCKHRIILLVVSNTTTEKRKKQPPHLRHCHVKALSHSFLNVPGCPSHIKSEFILHTRPAFVGMQLICAHMKGDIFLQGPKKKPNPGSPSAGTSSSVTSTRVRGGDWTGPGQSALQWKPQVLWHFPQSG